MKQTPLEINLIETPVLLTRPEVAEKMNVDKVTISRWEKKNNGFPKPIRINGRGDRRYLAEEIEEFINNRYEKKPIK